MLAKKLPRKSKTQLAEVLVGVVAPKDPVEDVVETALAVVVDEVIAVVVDEVGTKSQQKLNLQNQRRKRKRHKTIAAQYQLLPKLRHQKELGEQERLQQ
jgi:hypothetical protein